MAINTTNQLELVYKKLSGVLSTNNTFGVGNENIVTSIQLGSYQIFGDTIDENPQTAESQNVAKKTVFKLKGVAASLDSGVYYVLRLQKYNDTSTLWEDFTGQIIPFNFGADYYPSLYKTGAVTLQNSYDLSNTSINTDNQEDKNSDKNWFVDTAAGALWYQDQGLIPTAADYGPITEDWFVIAYEYTGRYLDEVAGTGGGGSGGGGVRTLNDDDVTTPLNIGTDDLFLIDATNKPIKVELPSASGNAKKRIVFKRIDESVNTVYVMGKKGITDGSVTAIEYIDDIGTDTAVEGSDAAEWEPGNTHAFYLYVKNETISLYCDGTKWHIT